jgi:hypothetical protein
MSSKITIKRSTTAIPPAGLSFGEMAFVQGTGLTANQLYVGISGGSPVWVGAQIGTTGSWTDNAAKTSLATQYAIDQRISSQISGGSPITTVSDNTNTTRYLVLSTSAAAGVTLFVDDTTGPLSYNPSTGNMIIAGNVDVGGDLTTNKGNVTIFNSSATSLGIGSAATGITMGATAGTFGIRNPSLTVGSSGITGTIFADDAHLVLTTKNYTGAMADPGDSSAKIIINDNIGAGFVNIEGGDLRLGNKTLSASVSGVDIVFEGTTDNTNELKLTAGDPGADYTVTLPHLTDTLVGKATTDTFTNKTYDTAGTGNVFRIAGVTLSGVTGTGSVVLSTSPTITTSLVSGSTGFALLNTTATTVNFAGAATTLTMGATSGSATIRNPILIVGTTAGIITTDNGNLQLIPGVFSGYYGTLPSISIDAASEGTGFVNIEGGNLRLGRKTDAEIVTTPVNLVFEGATDDGSDTTLSVVDPTANRTILLPNASDTLVGKATIDTFTNKTYDTAGTGNVFRIAGVTLSAVTGTGSVVLATSPALTTSLTTPSASFDLVNTTATTVNFAGAATALNMGVIGGTATFAGALTVSGNLTVNGTTTTINSTTLTVDDKNIEMAAIGTPDDATANGGGIIIKGTTDKSILWDSTNGNLTSNQDWNLPTGKVFKINNVSVLSSAALGSGITGSSLTQVGTITSGTWQGTQITDTYLATISTAGKVSNSATTATNLNTASAIVARDASGDFSARIITGNTFSGNASTATTATTSTNIVATEQTTGTIFLVGVAAASSSTGLLVNATPATALTYDVTSGELSATLIDGGSF